MPNHPITALAEEMYELMSGGGATPTAIREKPALMGLTYIRAEAPGTDQDAREDAVAATVRDFIEEATYALEEPVSQREDKDADRGAAARCLLGLYPGTGSMLLRERRQRAAGHLVKNVRTVTTRREVKGRMISHEMLLMEQLASQLWDRETDFLRDGNSSRPTHDIKDRDSPWLAVVHGAWNTARELSSALEQCCGGLQNPHPDREYLSRCDYNSLELFGKLWTYVMIPKQGDPWLDVMGKPEEELARMFPEGEVVFLYYFSPFRRATLERLSHEIVVAPDIAPIPVVSELIEPWRTWLGICQCDLLKPDLISCKVHLFRSSLRVYIEKLGECWEDLRDPYRSPRHYRPGQTPAEIFERYGLRVPAIDKYDTSTV
jgi:hypothetical protein